MRQVSRRTVFLVCLLAIIFSTLSALVLDQSRADAAVVHPTSVGKAQSVGMQYPMDSNLFISLSRPIELPQEYQASLADRNTIDWGGMYCAATGFATLGATTGVCNAVVDVAAEKLKDAKEFLENPGEAIQKLISDVGMKTVGGLVGWAGNGVVSLVTGQHEECMTGANGGGFDQAGQAEVCEARIALDYFPSQSDLAKQSAKAMQVASGLEIEELRKQIVKENDPAEVKKMSDNINNLQKSMATNCEANPNDQSCQKGAASSNDVFYVAKSPVATPVFDREYKKYVLIAMMLMVPMLIAAALQSVISAKPFLLFKSVIIMIPVAFLSIAIAPRVTMQLMAIIDGFCATILRDTRSDMQGFFGNTTVLAGGALVGIGTLLPFLIVALIFAFAAILVWFVLSMREASVALIAVFLPIAFAASIWPALSKWALRAIKLLVAAIISKLFIVGAISLGIGVFSGSSAGQQLSFSHLIYGSTIFFIAAFSPHLVMKFFDEIGDALNAAGGTGALQRGLSAAGNANGTKMLLGKQGGLAGMMGFGGGGGGLGGGGEGGGGGGGGAGVAQLAGQMAGLAGGSSAETGAASARSSKAGGGDGGAQAHAASMGAEEGTGTGAGGAVTGGDKAAAAYRGAGESIKGSSVDPGGTSSFGSMNEDQAGAVGAAVTSGAMANRVSQQDAQAMGNDAAGQAMGQTVSPGGPAATGTAATQAAVGGQASASGAAIAQQAKQQAKAEKKFKRINSIKGGAKVLTSPILAGTRWKG